MCDKGCEFCRGDSIISCLELDMYVDGKYLTVSTDGGAEDVVEINFCPMCGTKLGGSD